MSSQGPSQILRLPGGLVADRSNDLAALISNVNNYAVGIVNVTIAGTNVTLTATQALAGVVRLIGSASGPYTATLPITARLIDALGPTVATDGSFTMEFSFQNEDAVNVATLAIGDANTTLVGTVTIASNTRRIWLLKLTSARTITITNIGTFAATGGVPGTGTVTSVGLTMPAEFAVANSPITSGGTLAVTSLNENANTVWAGPTTGAPGTPAFRALVAADIPGGGGGVPGGANTDVQFNDGGAFGGVSGFTWDKVALALAVSGANSSATITGANATLVVTGSGSSLNVVGASSRILGLFNGATVAARTMLQTSNVNQPSDVGVIPNGTATGAALTAYATQPPTNSSFLQILSDAAVPAVINSGKTGTGTAQSLVIQTNAVEAARLDILSNWSLGLPTRATTATDGFVGLPATAGVPTGAATVRTGFVPTTIDTTDGRFYGYYAGAWHNLTGSASSGTVTSITAGTGLTGGTITTTGTIALDLAHINAWTKNQSVVPVAIASASTLNTDASLSNSFIINTLATNATLANPTNLTDGMILQWLFVQDGTGSRTLAYGTDFIFFGGVNTLSTAPGAVDLLSGQYYASLGKIVCQLATAAV